MASRVLSTSLLAAVAVVTAVTIFPTAAPVTISLVIPVTLMPASSRQDVFADPLGAFLQRSPPFPLPRQILAESLEVVPAETAREGDADCLRSVPGRKPHGDEIGGGLGPRFQTGHRRVPTGGAGDTS